MTQTNWDETINNIISTFRSFETTTNIREEQVALFHNTLLFRKEGTLVIAEQQRGSSFLTLTIHPEQPKSVIPKSFKKARSGKGTQIWIREIKII